MSIASRVWALSDEVRATRARVFKVICLKVRLLIGCQSDKNGRTFLISQVTKYLGKDGRLLQKNLKSLLILGCSPISKGCDKKKDKLLRATFKNDT